MLEAMQFRDWNRRARAISRADVAAGILLAMNHKAYIPIPVRMILRGLLPQLRGNTLRNKYSDQ